MSLTLNSTLQTAQDGNTHKIIIDINSEPIINDIPFDGEYLTEETLNEVKANCITHSTGRICTIYKFNSGYYKYVYTDVDRQEFSFVSISVAADFGCILGSISHAASLCELANGNIGIIAVINRTGYIDIKWMEITPTGSIIDMGLIESKSTAHLSAINSPDVIKLSDDSYFLTYLEAREENPTSGGTYTGTNNGQYEVVITQDGTETTAFFKYRKDDGGWSAEIQLTGAAQSLAEGVTITFPAANYYEGMAFIIPVTAAHKAVGYISITGQPDPLDTITIGATTYTFQTPPLIGGGNPNDVAIDIYAYEISLRNLVCAINDETYEGTGEGVRYGTGTSANASVEADMADFTMSLIALTAGAAGNSITLTFSDPFTGSGTMYGGLDASIGDCVAMASSLIKSRTSADFETWTADQIVSISTIGATRKDNASLILLDNDDIWLLFDSYDEINYANCYYTVSSDDGGSWGVATALTSYDSALASGKHPEIVQKAWDTLFLAYHEEAGALHLNSTSVGWPGGISSTTSIHVSGDYVYMINTYTGSGPKYFINVVEIEIETWEVTDYWDTTSTPAFHPFFSNVDCFANGMKHDGQYIVISNANDGAIGQWTPAVAVLYTEDDIIRHFFFKDNTEYGIIKNTDWTPSGITYAGVPYENRTIHFTAIYEDTLYVLMSGGHPFKKGIEIIAIDLTQPDIPNDDWLTTRVYSDAVGGDAAVFIQTDIVGFPFGDFKVYENYAILTNAHGTWRGRTIVFDKRESQWVITLDMKGDEETDYPYGGLTKVVFDGQNIWGTFNYNYHYDLYLKKGICKIHIGTSLVSFYEPVLDFQVDDYQLSNIEYTIDNKLIISSYAYGIILYNIGTNEWSLYSNTTVPGLTEHGDDYFTSVAFDPATGMLFAGQYYDAYYNDEGLTAFSQYGYLRHPLYKTGTYTDSWNFDEENDLVIGYTARDCAITLSPDDNGIFAFWTQQDQLEDSIKWDKETPQFNLLPYLIRSEPIVIKRAVENKPSSISFALSYGHLFDPFNAASIFRNYVKKGNKIVVRYGEEVSGVEYYQDMGTFIITERSMVAYERGKYPTIEITGKDKRYLWDEMEIIVGVDYCDGQTPEYILQHLLEDDCGELSADIDIPDFDNSTTLYVQFIKTTIGEILEQIMNRYGYFHKITVDDKFTCKKISNLNDINHYYYNADDILTYTPDDTFSDYTNKITVTCEGREYFENIKYEDTVVGRVAGTLGYWGQKKTITVWFDDEHKKQFVPLDITRIGASLTVIQSAEAGMMFQLAGDVEEDITEWDENNRYCVVKVSAPDLRPMLLALLISYAAATIIPDDGDPIKQSAKQIIEVTAITGIIMILASIAAYNLEIHGFPVGYDRRTWQASAYDTELYSALGKWITKEIEEPLAYYIDEAQVVADYEMLITQLQRRRIKISKVAHIQDEEGDTIQFTHPYSGRAINMFVTNLTRSLKLPENPDGSGTFIDELEGWIL